jgi:hypothetical protein
MTNCVQVVLILNLNWSFFSNELSFRQRLDAKVKTKVASSVTTAEIYPEIKVSDQLSRATKLNELGKMIRGF